MTPNIRLRTILFAGVVALSAPALAQEAPEDRIPQKIKMKEAVRLMNYANPIDSHVYYFASRPDEQVFFWMELFRKNADGHSGFYVVNPWTGAVWDILWECHKRFSTPALEKARAAIRRRFTAVEMTDYRYLDDIDPGCMVDEN